MAPRPERTTAPPPPRRGGLCSRRTLAVLLLLSAVPAALLVALELRAAGPSAYRYRSRGWLRECAMWDEASRRFLVSTLSQGGISAVEEGQLGAAAEERPLFRDPDANGSAALGIAIDRPRGRLLVVYADANRKRPSALGAYGLDTWDRIFLTELSGAGEADDVAVDLAGNAYVTDVAEGKIWTVGPDGAPGSVIRSPLFRPKEHWFHNLFALNGIVHHPDGYLLVIHTSTGSLLKVHPAAKDGEEDDAVSVVRVSGGSLLMGDGMELLSPPSKLVVAGSLGTATVESDDGWETARVTGWYYGPAHRIACAATVKDGKVFVNYMVGGGIRHKTHLITEAVFKPVVTATSK